MRDLRVIFVGDSFVTGVGDRDLLGWAGRLCRRVATDDLAVTQYNLGVRRDTSTDIAARWEREVLARSAVAPKLVFSWGVNDTAIESGRQRVPTEESDRNFSVVVGLAVQRWPVFFIGPPPVLDSDHNQRIAALTGKMRARADAMDVGFMSPLDALRNDSVWQAEVAAGDGSHPDRGGYDNFTAIIENDRGWQEWIKQ